MGDDGYHDWPETLYTTVVRAIVQRPLTISLQEVCNDQWLTIGQSLYPYGYRALYYPTISSQEQAHPDYCSGNQSRGNAVYAIGDNLGTAGPPAQLQPIEPDVQRRYLVCMKSQFYVPFTTCSTHATTALAYRVNQANFAIYYWGVVVRPEGVFGVTGADFNQVHPTSATNNWLSANAEWALPLQLITHYIPPLSGNKIDYIWADNAVFSQLSPQPCDFSAYSDHFPCTGRFG